MLEFKHYIAYVSVILYKHIHTLIKEFGVGYSINRDIRLLYGIESTVK